MIVEKTVDVGLLHVIDIIELSPTQELNLQPPIFDLRV